MGGVLLADVVATSATVAATRSRKAKVAAIASLLSEAAPEELETVTAYVGGSLRQLALDFLGEKPRAIRCVLICPRPPGLQARAAYHGEELLPPKRYATT